MNNIKQPLTSIPDDILSLNDYQRWAQDMLPHGVYEYIASGCADDITLQKNQSAFQQLDILPSILNEFNEPSTKVNLLGDVLAHPFLLAPVAHQQLVHTQGELATAAAANAMNTGLVASTLSNYSLERIAGATESTKWFQLYFQTERELTLNLLRRAEASGYTAIVVTIDAPVNGLRHRPQRAGFHIPPEIKEANFIHPCTQKPYSSPQRTLQKDQSIILDGFMADAPRWSDLEWLKNQTSLPVIVKGVLNPQDATRLQNMGMDGIVVSNHGGRTLDTLPAAINQLPLIRETVGQHFLILMDSGIRRGTDIFKAIALGANAVLLGRPQVYSLAVAGALGVAHMIQLLKQELEMTMALAGCPTIANIHREQILSSSPM